MKTRRTSGIAGQWLFGLEWFFLYRDRYTVPLGLLNRIIICTLSHTTSVHSCLSHTTSVHSCLKTHADTDSLFCLKLHTHTHTHLSCLKLHTHTSIHSFVPSFTHTYPPTHTAINSFVSSLTHTHKIHLRHSSHPPLFTHLSPASQTPQFTHLSPASQTPQYTHLSQALG